MSLGAPWIEVRLGLGDEGGECAWDKGKLLRFCFHLHPPDWHASLPRRQIHENLFTLKASCLLSILTWLLGGHFSQYI